MERIDYRQLVSQLSKQQRQRLTEKSDGAGLLYLGAHLGTIVACGWYVALRLPWFGIVMFLEGVLIVFLFMPLHETIHRTAFKTAWLNDAVALFCGFLVFLSPTWFRYFHFAHHRHTHDPKRDPELVRPKPKTRLGYWIYMLGLIETIERIRSLINNAFFSNTDGFVPLEARRRVCTQARLFVAGYLVVLASSVVMGSSLLLWVWILPLLLGNPLLRGYLMAEHTGCPHVANMLENTRTMFTHPIGRFVTWNMPYHVEHHVHPGVPFHKLPAFHQIIRPSLVHTEKGYVRFNRKHYRRLASPVWHHRDRWAG